MENTQDEKIDPWNTEEGREDLRRYLRALLPIFERLEREGRLPLPETEDGDNVDEQLYEICH